MNLGDLWRADGTGVESFRLVMIGQAFNFSSAVFRFYNIHTRQERSKIDKRAPIRTILNRFNSNIRQCYSHSAHFIIDEKL